MAQIETAHYSPTVPSRAAIHWRFVALWVVIGFAVVEALYFAFRPGGLVFFGLGFDQNTYFAAARDFLGGRGFYESYQLAGPYEINAHEILYPPLLLGILIPFTFLPDPLWVIVPAILTGWIVISWRPTYWAVFAIALCLAWPSSSGLYLLGNPGIWAVLLVAVATRWEWAGPLVMIKPSLMPFALVGIRSRSWWLGAAALLAVVAATWPMWRDYIAAMFNARGASANVLYSLWTSPMMLVPVLAWLGSTRRRDQPGNQ
jgi:hypothetical protein